MIRISRYISGLSLSIALLAFIFHMIIPHDHHMAEINSLPGDKCPASENNTSHNNGLPVHCYSLNDLASEKATRFQIAEQLKFSVIEQGRLTLHSVLYPDVYCIEIFENTLLPYDSWLIESSPLRAPPSLS